MSDIDNISGDISDDILFYNMVDTGYPDLLVKYLIYPNFEKIYNDNNLWMILLQKDYPEIVKIHIFSKAKETYITLYNNFIDKSTSFAHNIFLIYIDAIKNDNLDLIKLLITDHIQNLEDEIAIYNTYPICLKKFIFKLGIHYKSYDIINYLSTIDEYIEIFLICITDSNISHSKSVLTLMNITLSEYENIIKLFLHDKKFDKCRILIISIINNEIDIAKFVVDYIDETKISDMIIMTIKHNCESIFLLLLPKLNQNIIEQCVMDLINSNNSNIKRYLLSILISFESEYNNLFINIMRYKKITESAMFCIKYILLTKKLDRKAINKSAIYTAINNNIKLFNILSSHELFDPLYNNSLLLRVSDKKCLNMILTKIVTQKNINDFLLDIISYEVKCNEVLDIISYEVGYDERSVYYNSNNYYSEKITLYKNDIAYSENSIHYNNDVLNSLLTLYKVIIDTDILQTYLLVTINNNNSHGFLLIFNTLRYIKKDIIDECLQIAYTKNILPVVNALLDHSSKNNNT